MARPSSVERALRNAIVHGVLPVTAADSRSDFSLELPDGTVVLIDVKESDTEKGRVWHLTPENSGPRLDIERASDVEALNPDDEVTEEEFQTAARAVPGKSRGELLREQQDADADLGSEDVEG